LPPSKSTIVLLTSIKSTRRRDVISGAFFSRVGVEGDADERTNRRRGCMQDAANALEIAAVVWGTRCSYKRLYIYRGAAQSSATTLPHVGGVCGPSPKRSDQCWTFTQGEEESVEFMSTHYTKSVLKETNHKQGEGCVVVVVANWLSLKFGGKSSVWIWVTCDHMAVFFQFRVFFLQWKKKFGFAQTFNIDSPQCLQQCKCNFEVWTKLPDLRTENAVSILSKHQPRTRFCLHNQNCVHF
jgi:hypothetical protein